MLSCSCGHLDGFWNLACLGDAPSSRMVLSIPFPTEHAGLALIWQSMYTSHLSYWALGRIKCKLKCVLLTRVTEHGSCLDHQILYEAYRI